MKSLKQTARLSVTIFLLVITGVGLAIRQQAPTQARSAGELQQEAAALQQKIDEAQAQANQLTNQATSLENTIGQLDAEITQVTTSIELISVKIAQLEEELKAAEKELERQKGLLRANMRALYKRGGASTVELLAASDSFSEFIDEQEYLERLKASIQGSTEKVLALKQDIEAKKNEQVELKKQQEAAKQTLDHRRQERANLLAETRGNEARFQARVGELTEQQRAINRELARKSRVVSIGGSSYPWNGATCAATGRTSGDCPNFEWYAGSSSDRQDPWGYYYRNCTSYVAWKSAKMGLEVPGMGNGGAWASNAWKHDLSTGSSPKRGAFAVFSTGGYGHVAYVEAISGNEVLVSEFNFVADGEYSERWISKSQPSSYVYTPWSN